MPEPTGQMNNPDVGFFVSYHMLQLIQQDTNFTQLNPGLRGWIKQVLGDYSVKDIPTKLREQGTEYLRNNHIKTPVAA